MSSWVPPAQRPHVPEVCKGERAGAQMEQDGEQEAPCRTLLREQVQCPRCGKGMCCKTLMYKHTGVCRPLAERRAAYDARAAAQATSRANSLEARGPEGQAWAPVKSWRTMSLAPQWRPGNGV